MRDVRRVHRRHRDRWPVCELHPRAGAAGEPHRPTGRDRHDRGARALCRLDTAGGADRAAGRGGECAPVVRVYVSHSQTRGPGVAQMKMRLSGIGYRLSVVLALFATPLAAQTSLSIYRDGRVVVRRTLPQALQQGRNALTLRLEALDPATMFSPDTSVTVVSATARYPSTKSDALAHAIGQTLDRKSTRLNSSHLVISYAVFCLKKKKINSNVRDMSPIPHGSLTSRSRTHHQQ